MGVLRDLPAGSDLEGPRTESTKKGKEAGCLQEAGLQPSRSGHKHAGLEDKQACSRWPPSSVG